MKKQIFASLLMSVIPSVVFGIGTIDKRQYVNWNTYPYNVYVRICSYSGCGTGEFITPRHILTNKHVAECCGINGASECSVSISDGTKKYAKVVETGGGLSDCKFVRDKHSNTGKDWSIIEILDTNFYHTYFTITSTITGNGFSRAGFGGLKVLTNDDVKNIKIAYEKWLKKVFPYNFMNRKEVASLGANLEYGNYSIYDGMVSDGYKSTVTYQTFLDEFKRLTGKDFYANYLHDSSRLKFISPCGIKKVTSQSITHTCDGWHGDSGSAILSGSQIVGLDNRGFSYVSATEKAGDTNFGVPVTSEMQNAIKRVKEKQNKIEPEPNPKPKPKPKPKPDPKPEPKPNPKPSPNPGPDERDIGLPCLESDLPPHATEGHYIKSGLKKYDCKNGSCSCAATQCEKGYFLVVNKSGNSQGWCYTRSCPVGYHLNIIDGYKTDTKCVVDTDTVASVTNN